MKQRLFALAAAVVMALGLTACGGSGSSEGRTGDTMETYFFDFTVNSAYLTSDYEGYTPATTRAVPLGRGTYCWWRTSP